MTRAPKGYDPNLLPYLDNGGRAGVAIGDTITQLGNIWQRSQERKAATLAENRREKREDAKLELERQKQASIDNYYKAKLELDGRDGGPSMKGHVVGRDGYYYAYDNTGRFSNTGVKAPAQGKEIDPASIGPTTAEMNVPPNKATEVFGGENVFYDSKNDRFRVKGSAAASYMSDREKVGDIRLPLQ